MKELKITIPTPCTVSRDNMTETENGWFCDVCSKEVIDFREKTDAQIADAFESESPCGVFWENQLDRSIAPKPATLSCWRASSILRAASLAMAGALALEGCFMDKQGEPKHPTPPPQTEVKAPPVYSPEQVEQMAQMEATKARIKAEMDAIVSKPDPRMGKMIRPVVAGDTIVKRMGN
jgi:hypothetical protein